MLAMKMYFELGVSLLAETADVEPLSEAIVLMHIALCVSQRRTYPSYAPVMIIVLSNEMSNAVKGSG